jgi:hypothetical protein
MVGSQDHNFQLDPRGKMLLNTTVVLDTISTKRGLKMSFNGTHKRVKIVLSIEGPDVNEDEIEEDKKILGQECLIWVEYVSSEQLETVKAALQAEEEEYQEQLEASEEIRHQQAAERSAQAERDREELRQAAREARDQAEAARDNQSLDNILPAGALVPKPIAPLEDNKSEPRKSKIRNPDD